MSSSLWSGFAFSCFEPAPAKALILLSPTPLLAETESIFRRLSAGEPASACAAALEEDDDEDEEEEEEEEAPAGWRTAFRLFTLSR